MSSRIYSIVEKDSTYSELKSQLFNEFTAHDELIRGEVYYKVLNGVINVLAKADSINYKVELNNECWIIIEDIATSGICRYPWKVVKMIILVIWGYIFDEVYEVENYNNDNLESVEEFEKNKQNLFACLLEFETPPFTLQRLCEIPLKQPYKVLSKLFNAYRKLFNTRQIEFDPVSIPIFVNLDDFELLNNVYENLDKWILEVKGPHKPQWSDDLWGINSDDESIE